MSLARPLHLTLTTLHRYVCPLQLLTNAPSHPLTPPLSPPSGTYPSPASDVPLEPWAARHAPPLTSHPHCPLPASLHLSLITPPLAPYRYVPPLQPVTSLWSLELPDTPAGLEDELRKQESLLNQLHQQVARGNDAKKEDRLWEVQRVVTQLNRKVRGQGSHARSRRCTGLKLRDAESAMFQPVSIVWK